MKRIEQGVEQQPAISFSVAFSLALLSRRCAHSDVLPEMKKTLHYVFVISLLLCWVALGDLAKDPFFKPYIEELKKTTDKNEILQITAMDESELILLHHGYGTGIRNRWLHGDRDPELLKFFKSKQIEDHDEMSMVMIQALWEDLNSNLTADQIKEIAVKRAIVKRKQINFATLESECAAQLTLQKDKFARLYEEFGLPSSNESLREPFSKLIVGKNGKVKNIVFYDGASEELKLHLTKIIKSFVFSPFID